MKHEIYFSDGKLREEGEIIEGVKSGLWLEYYSNGNIKIKKNFDAGKKHGPFEYYKENGDLDFQLDYHAGHLKLTNFKINRFLKQ